VEVKGRSSLCHAMPAVDSTRLSAFNQSFLPKVPTQSTYYCLRTSAPPPSPHHPPESFHNPRCHAPHAADGRPEGRGDTPHSDTLAHTGIRTETNVSHSCLYKTHAHISADSTEFPPTHTSTGHVSNIRAATTACRANPIEMAIQTSSRESKHPAGGGLAAAAGSRADGSTQQRRDRQRRRRPLARRRRVRRPPPPPSPAGGGGSPILPMAPRRTVAGRRLLRRLG
jgi:hypothetical protein